MSIKTAAAQSDAAGQSDTLSIHRSFVLRLCPGAELEAGDISGRIEHVLSGEMKEFRSAGELLSAIGVLLRRENKNEV